MKHKIYYTTARKYYYILEIIISFLKIIVIKILSFRRGRLFLNVAIPFLSIVERFKNGFKRSKNTNFEIITKSLRQKSSSRTRAATNSIQIIPMTHRKLCNSGIISQPEYKRANKFT